MFDPIFDLLAGLLAFFYSVWPSYGFAIIALTFVVLLAFTPLTYKSTKSIVAMRRLQPSIKRLQKKHAGDRETMNQELMALYQEHNVNPLSGCLPILIQSPVFIVLFRVVRGITRRASDIGFRAGESVAALTRVRDLGVDETFVPADSPTRKFNPEIISEDSELYLSLVDDSEMLWLGVDLSRTPLEVVTGSFSESFPYLLMIAVVAVLGWYQQRQIAGRSTGEISAQQQMIMRVLPWMLPIFSFTMPAGLVLYFIVSALLRVGQQAYITRTVYGDEELTAPLELDEDPDLDDDDDDEPENPLASLFGGPKPAPAPSSKHGSRRPTSGTVSSKSRVRPPRDTPSSAGTGTKDSGSARKKRSEGRATGTARSKRTSGFSRPAETATGWGKAKRTAKNEAPEKPVSRRVTPKRDSAPTNRRRKR